MAEAGTLWRSPIFKKMSKQQIFAICASFYVAYIVWSFSKSIFPPIFGTIIPIFMLLVCIVLYPFYLVKNISFLWSIIYVLASLIVVCFHKLSGYGFAHGGFDTLLIEFAWVLPSIAIGGILTKMDKHSIKTVFRTFIITFALSLIYIVPVAMTNTSAIRSICVADMFGQEVDHELLAYVPGFWGYTMFHIVALSLALFWGLAFYCTSFKARITYLCLFVGAMIVVVQSCISTTQFYMIIVVVMLLWHQWEKAHTVVTVFIIIGIALVATNLNAVLDFLMDYYQGTSVVPKLIDIKDLINGGTGYHSTIDGRLNYQQDALDAFYRNIFIGDTYSGGGHSIILNRLGSLGLIGFIPFILMIYYQFRQWYKLMPKISRYYFLLSWAGAALLMYSKNCFNQEGYLFICIVIPISCLMFHEPTKSITHRSSQK